MKKLADAIKSLAPDYGGLEDVFDTYLVSHVFNSADARKEIAAHLKKHWFDDASPGAFFAGQRVAATYAEGVLQAIGLSLKATPPVPITAWWLVDSPSVKMLNLADGHGVMLLIQTPRPQGEVGKGKVILGDSHAWVSECGSAGAAPTTSEVARTIE